MKNLILIFIFASTLRCMTLEEAFRANNLFAFQAKNESQVQAPEHLEPKESHLPSIIVDQGLEEKKRINFLEDSLRTIEKDTASSYENMNRKLETLTNQISKLTDKIESLEKNQSQKVAAAPVAPVVPQEPTFKTVAVSLPEKPSMEKPEIKGSFTVSSRESEKATFGAPSAFVSSQNNQMASTPNFNPQITQSYGSNSDMSSYAIGGSPYNTNQAFQNYPQASQMSVPFQNQMSSYGNTPSLRGSANTMFANSNFQTNNSPYFNSFGANQSPEVQNYRTVSYSSQQQNAGRGYYSDESSPVEADTIGF